MESLATNALRVNNPNDGGESINIKLSEAPSFGKPINIYDKGSIGAKRYEEFAREFLGQKIYDHNIINSNKIQQYTEKISE